MRKSLILGTAALLAGSIAFAHNSAQAYTITGIEATPGSQTDYATLNLGTGNGLGFQNASTLNTGNNGDLANYGISQISFDQGSPLAGVYSGSLGSVAKSPFSSFAPGSKLNYLVAETPGNGGSGNVTVNFASAQTSLTLLWGTVDAVPADYNKITFTVGGTTVNGAAVAAAIAGLTDHTDGAWVTITDLPSFTTATFSASNIAFEFDVAKKVPAPAALGLLGAGLLGLGVLRRRREV